MKQSEPVKRPTIYSIGYQKLPSPDILGLLTEILDADLFDVRSKPVSRKKGFGKNQLAALLGDRYQWHGATLGGMAPGVTADGIEILKAISRPAILMCMEEAPGACHRHLHIATAMFGRGIDIAHIYRDVIFRASWHQWGIDNDSDDYPFNHLDQIAELGGFDAIEPGEHDPPIEGPLTGNIDLMRRHGMTDAIR